MNARNFQPQPLILEKVIAALSYITFGLVGFFWLLLALFTKNNLKPYLMYHVAQSMFLSFLFFLTSIILGLAMNVLGMIPFVNQLVLQLTLLLNMPMILGFSLIQTGIYALIFYLVITSFQGQLSYIPWVSDIIKMNIRQ